MRQPSTTVPLAQQTLTETFVLSSPALPVILKFPILRDTLDLMLHWFCRRLCFARFLGAEKDQFEKCRKLIGFLKRFMEPNTIIEQIEPEGSLVFVRKMTELAKTTESKVLNYLHQPNILAIWSTSTKDPKLTQCTIAATYKKLQTLHAKHRELFPNHVNVDDRVTPPSMIYAFN